jgi:hypothetical protein
LGFHKLPNHVREIYDGKAVEFRSVGRANLYSNGCRVDVLYSDETAKAAWAWTWARALLSERGGWPEEERPQQKQRPHHKRA